MRLFAGLHVQRIAAREKGLEKLGYTLLSRWPSVLFGRCTGRSQPYLRRNNNATNYEYYPSTADDVLSNCDAESNVRVGAAKCEDTVDVRCLRLEEGCIIAR